MFTFTTSIEHCAGSSSQYNNPRAKAEVGGWLPDWKTKVKLSSLTDDMIIYLENPIESTKIMPDLVSETSTFAGFKIDIQKISCASICYQ